MVCVCTPSVPPVTHRRYHLVGGEGSAGPSLGHLLGVAAVLVSALREAPSVF